MRMKTELLLALIGAALLLAGCGAPGAPQPPSLQLPRRVEDLAATRKGDKVTLSWTPPRQTTDGQNLRLQQLGPTQLCRGINDFPMTGCAQPIGEVPPSPPPPPVQPAPKASFTDTLPAALQAEQPLAAATYGVAVLNARGRSAGLSNQLQVPLAPTLPPPPEIKAQLRPDGIQLSWPAGGPVPSIAGLSFAYRVYREQPGMAEQTAIATEPAAGAPPVVIDRTFQWESTYRYHVTPVTTVRHAGTPELTVEGADSPTVTVVAHDIFPPAVPGGLQAVYSGVGQKPFIDLTWAPDTDADLAGYNVYRHEAGTAPRKLNRELLTTPSFRDTEVVPGKTYIYAVTAVDLRGNESPKSEATSETAP